MSRDVKCLGFANYSTAMVVLFCDNEQDVYRMVRHAENRPLFLSDPSEFLESLIKDNPGFWGPEFKLSEVVWAEIREQYEIEFAEEGLSVEEDSNEEE